MPRPPVTVTSFRERKRLRRLRRCAVSLVVSLVAALMLLASGAEANNSYRCDVAITGDVATVTFSGDRAHSENLRVDGQWVATVTGLSELDIATGQVVEVRLRGRGYDGPEGFHTKRCTPTNGGAYVCDVSFDGGDAVLTLGGDRGYSENLLVDGAWHSTVTGSDSVVVTGGGENFEMRLRGLGWNGPGGYHAFACAVPGPVLAPLEPQTGVLIGAYPAGGSSGFRSSQAAVTAFEADTSTSLDIVQVFNPPHQPAFQVDLANIYLSQNKIPLITWKVGPSQWPNPGDGIADRVIAGEFDNQIRARAAEAKQINGPFFSRLFHEPDGTYGERYDLTEENSRAYWSRIRTIFDEEGVTNAVWVWTAARLESDEFGFYPGDDLVDWIGADPYQWIGTADAARCAYAPGRYEPLRERLGTAFWQFAAEHPDKPIMLAEWGTGWIDDDEPGSDVRSRFIDSATDAVASEPRIKALVYFNSNTADGCGWVLTDGPGDGVAAYERLANNPAHYVDIGALIANFTPVE